MQIRLPNPFMAKVYVYPHYSVNTPKTPTPSMQVALQPQPFVYPGMQIQHATRLMREVCALRHLSINTEKSYLHSRPPGLAQVGGARAGAHRHGEAPWTVAVIVVRTLIGAARRCARRGERGAGSAHNQVGRLSAIADIVPKSADGQELPYADPLARGCGRREEQSPRRPDWLR